MSAWIRCDLLIVDDSWWIAQCNATSCDIYNSISLLKQAWKSLYIDVPLQIFHGTSYLKQLRRWKRSGTLPHSWQDSDASLGTHCVPKHRTMMRKERSTEPNLSNSQGVVPNVGGLSGSYVARFTVHRMLDVCLNTSFSFVHSPVTSPNEKQTNQSLVITNLDSNAGCCHCKTFFVQILVETEKTQLTDKKQQPTTSNKLPTRTSHAKWFTSKTSHNLCRFQYWDAAQCN